MYVCQAWSFCISIILVVTSLQLQITLTFLISHTGHAVYQNQVFVPARPVSFYL